MASIAVPLAGLALLAGGFSSQASAGFTGRAAIVPSATAAAGSCDAPHWVGTWAADPSDGAGLDYVYQTLRVIVTPHFAGTQLRVHLSNRFGSGPVTFGSASIGVRGSGASVVAGTDQPLTFDGSSQVTVAPGTDVVSDPVSMSFKSMQELAVSVYVAGDSGPSTEHVAGDETSYITPPNSVDATTDETGDPFTLTTTRTSFVDGLDVLAPGTVSALVAVGDSITDGIESFVVPATQSAAIDANSRYTDDLTRRLGSKSRISVVNAGISGNQLLDTTVPQAGPSGLQRLQDDVLNVPGVSDVLIVLGITDLGQGKTAADVEAGLTAAVAQLHAAGLNVLVATIMPVGGVVLPTYASPAVEAYRQTINNWIRAGGSGADGVVDFDGALRDPSAPTRLLPAYDSGDHVHPSNAGYKAMSEAIDPALIRGTNCGGATASNKLPTTLRVRVATGTSTAARVTGRLSLDAPSSNCIGTHVKLSEVAGKRTIAHRVVRLYAHCAFAVTLAIPGRGAVELEANYAGNALLGPSHAKLRLRG